MIMKILHRVHFAAPWADRVQRTVRGRGEAFAHRERGFSLLEVVITMVVLSIGLLSLAPLMIAVVRGNRFAQDMTLATTLAEDRMEEILHNPVYANITEANFPSEAQGQIHQGDPKYDKFGRTVTIVDSLNILSQSEMKNLTVTVSWWGLNQRIINVTLYGRVARF